MGCGRREGAVGGGAVAVGRDVAVGEGTAVSVTVGASVGTAVADRLVVGLGLTSTRMVS